MLYLQNPNALYIKPAHLVMEESKTVQRAASVSMLELSKILMSEINTKRAGRRLSLFFFDCMVF